MPYATDMIDQAAQYVQAYLLDALPMGRYYHNFEHAEEIAEVGQQLARAAGRSDEQILIVQLAGLFHDAGYASHPDRVAEGSVQLATKFLESHGTPGAVIDEVARLIRSVHADDPPQDDLERILHDANISFIGRKRFFRRSKLLRLEREHMEERKFTSYAWNQYLLELLTTRRFMTPWAQNRFASRLGKNIVQQRQNLRKAHERTTRKQTGKDFGRGVDTLYRVTLRNHINLSRIADGKANIIISINTLVLSIILAAGAAGFSFEQAVAEGHSKFFLPVIMLMLTALLAIVFAVLSATPKVSGETFDEDDIKQHKVSMLFFGNFLQIDKPEFVQHLRELKKDQELLYDDLSRDLYNLGMVLRKKYRLLAISYRVFLGGLVLSILTLLVSLFI